MDDKNMELLTPDVEEICKRLNIKNERKKPPKTRRNYLAKPAASKREYPDFWDGGKDFRHAMNAPKLYNKLDRLVSDMPLTDLLWDCLSQYDFVGEVLNAEFSGWVQERVCQELKKIGLHKGMFDCNWEKPQYSRDDINAAIAETELDIKLARRRMLILRRISMHFSPNADGVM